MNPKYWYKQHRQQREILCVGLHSPFDQRNGKVYSTGGGTHCLIRMSKQGFVLDVCCERTKKAIYTMVPGDRHFGCLKDYLFICTDRALYS